MRTAVKLAGVAGAFVAMGAGLLGGCASASKGAATLAEPVAGWDDVKNVSRAGETTFAGQPSEAALERYAGEGGTMVIDIRTHEGGDGAGFDEAAKVAGLGMDYVHIPVSPATMSTADVKRFVQAMREARGPVMVHCGSSNRVGGLWAAYLALEEGWDTEAAMEAGRAAGMRSESVEEAARRVIGR